MTIFSFETLLQALYLQLRKAQSAQEEKCWDTHLVNLIQKSSETVLLGNFPPIAILAVLYKMYSRFLGLLLGPILEDTRAPQFAFKKGYQAPEVVHILRCLIDNYREYDKKHRHP